MALRQRAGKWSWRFMTDGREYSGASGLAATKRNATAASRMEAEHQQAVKDGRQRIRKIQARKFSDAAKEYIALRDAECRAHPSTAKRIETSFASLLEAMGGKMVASIGAAEIEAYKAWRLTDHQVRDVTLRHDLHALSGFYRWAMRCGYAGENPVREVAIPSDKDAVRMHVLSATEERAYFAAAMAEPDLHDFSRVLLNQGMRPDELLSLTAGYMDLAAGTAKVQAGKTKAARRTLTLTPESRSILARRCAGRTQDESLWPWGYQGMLYAHRRACGGAGVDFLPYDLRHTFATRMAEAGCDLATLAAIIGHAGLRVVHKYVHPTAEHQRAAMLRYGVPGDARPEAVQ